MSQQKMIAGVDLKKLPREALFILVALKEYFGLPKNQLGRVTGLIDTTLKNFLEKLVKSSYIYTKRYGAHTYYFISPEIINMLEPEWLRQTIPQLNTLQQLARTEPIRAARTCYGHLAGVLGVSLMEKLVTADFIKEKDNHFSLTTQGTRKFSMMGLKDCGGIQPCLDGTERKFHLAGSFGKALTEFFFRSGWVEYSFPYTRAIKVTSYGNKNFFSEFDLLVDKNTLKSP